MSQRPNAKTLTAAPITAPPESRLVATIFETHQRKVFCRILSLVGDRELAADLTQETFLRVFQHQECFTSVESAWPWLRTTAGNVVISYHRRHSAEKRGGKSSRQGIDANSLTATSIPPLELAVQQEHRTLLFNAIDMLSDAEKQLILSHFAGLSPDEIASETGRPKPTITSSLSRIKKKLVQLLSRHAA